MKLKLWTIEELVKSPSMLSAQGRELLLDAMSVKLFREHFENVASPPRFAPGRES